MVMTTLNLKLINMEQSKRYYIPNLESGHSEEVTKEQYDSYIKMRAACSLNFNPTYGHILIFGTGEDMNTNELKDIFYNPSSYNIIPLKSGYDTPDTK